MNIEEGEKLNLCFGKHNSFILYFAMALFKIRYKG